MPTYRLKPLKEAQRSYKKAIGGYRGPDWYDRDPPEKKPIEHASFSTRRASSYKLMKTQKGWEVHKFDSKGYNVSSEPLDVGDKHPHKAFLDHVVSKNSKLRD